MTGVASRWCCLVIAAAIAVRCSAVDIMSWNDGVEAMRHQAYPGYCVYIGRQHSELLERLRTSTIDTAGIPIIHLSSRDEVINPYTNQTVTGARLILNLTGPVNDLTGGCLIFFDHDGVLLPHFTAIQNFHRNRPEVVELYCKMVASPLREKLSLLEFSRLEDLKIGQVLAVEAAENKFRDFRWLFREVPKDEIYFRGVDADGKPIDPRIDSIITVVTRDPAGEVFIAQMCELWEKLSIPDGSGGFHRPPLVVLGPAQARYPALDAMGIRYRIGYLTDEQLAPLTTPMIVLPGNAERAASEFHGFIPGQVLGSYILSKEQQGLLNNLTLLNPDIPVGDYDYTAPAASPAPVAASGRTEAR